MVDPIEQRRATLTARFPVWSPTTLDGFLDRCAAEFPDRPLVLTDDETLTYAQTQAWSRRLADGLAALGVRRGDRVGMVMANHLEFTPLKFAIARAGAVAVPFNYLYRAAELAYVLRQARCTVLITMAGFAVLDYPVGGAIIPRTAFTPADYVAGIERHRATEILCVPTMTVALLESPDRAGRDLSSVFAILSGAAPAPVWLWEKVRAELGITEITTGYGMTECGGAMTMSLPEDPLERHSATVGRVKLAGAAGLPDRDGGLCRYRTVDPVDGTALPDGAEGELVSRGPTHMLGFWDKPDETAAGLRDGWVFSGDLGRVRDDGYLQITGRSKELYKSGGELVMSKEIEELLTRLPGVSQAYLVAVPDETWGEVGCAWIVPEAGVTLDPDELTAVCRDGLARFKVPRHVLLTTSDALPTTPTGKVQKFRLASRAAELLAR